MNVLRRLFQSVFLSVILSCFSLITLPHFAGAAWSPDSKGNAPVCTAPSQQCNPLIISDGAGGAIILWEDTRNVHFDIYVQRIDAHGKVLWMKDGVPVCNAPEKQNKPRIISDGAGGAIITWQDIRSGSNNSNIYAQRIDADGKLQWEENGIPVCTEVNAQNSPGIASDGAGGAIIIWQDFRTNYADLYAQRIDKNGELLWKKDGVPVCLASGAQSAPVVAEDGAGGIIVAWQDFRRTYADIYAQRVDGSGNVLWEKRGVPVCTALGHESYQVIMSNGAEGAIIAWVDTRNGNNDVFAQQVDGNGAMHWKVDGIPVCTAPGNQNYPVITGDGAGGVLLSWWDMRSGEFDVYAQHVDLAGNASWADNGLAVCVDPNIQNNVAIASNGAGGATLAWNDNRGGDPTFDVYVQQIDAKGVAQWNRNGLLCSAAPDTQCFPVLVNDGAGGAIIAWQDSRNRDTSYWDIYAQKVNKQGFLGE